jgi:ABC-type polysaccharide/polyol phosphate export permease
MTPQYDLAINDITHGALHWQMWSRMGWLEIRRRYRRTLIGPFWTSFSLALFIVTLGFLWAKLWHQDPHTYLPYLCSGMVTWVFIAAIISEGCMTFVASEALIKTLTFPYTMLACVVVWRNFVVFLHNALIFVGVAIYGGVPLDWNTMLIIPNLILVGLTGVWVATLLGLLCLRFRDIQQLVTSLLQIAMFVTPIFYAPDQLQGRMEQIVRFNPLFHYVELIRLPMMGLAPSIYTYEVTIGCTIFGWLATLYIYSRFRRRLPYWL